MLATTGCEIVGLDTHLPFDVLSANNSTQSQSLAVQWHESAKERHDLARADMILDVAAVMAQWFAIFRVLRQSASLISELLDRSGLWAKMTGSRTRIFLGVDSPFCSTIVLFNNPLFSLGFVRFSRKKDP